MNKNVTNITITLKNGKVITYTNDYVWFNFERELNDPRNKFIQVGDTVIATDEIVTVEKENLVIVEGADDNE